MENPKNQFSNVDEYIDSFPENVGEMLKAIRSVIKEEIPEAEEAIKYQIPTFVLNGSNLIHFAAFKNHVGIYPITAEMEAAIPELTHYKAGRGTIRLPLNQSLPLSLIRKVARFRVKEKSAKK